MANYMKQWRTIDVATKAKRSKTGGIGYSANQSWYNELMTTSVSRAVMINRYNDMDNTVDISRALDIMSEDVSSDDYTDEDPILFKYPDEITKSQVKTLDKTLEMWLEMTEFDYKFFDSVRELLKYGIVLYRKNKDGKITKLIQERIVGYILDKKDRNKVEKYLYDNSKEFKDKVGDVVRKENDDIDEIPVKDLLVMKLGERPLGESIMEKVYRIWRQLNLLEDAVVIYRIVRAPERRVFYIDTGNVSGTKAKAYLTKMKNELRQKQLVKDNSSLETQYNPSSMIEDYFIAQSGEGRGSKVETIQGGENLGRIEDLMYFNKKLSLGLRIPPSYLDSFSEGEGAQTSDGRVGTAYIAEMRYASFIKRLQKSISKTLLGHFKEFSVNNDVEIPDGVKFEIAPPQNFALYKQNELHSAMLNVYSSADSMDVLSKVEALKKFMGMDEKDILENTEAKLFEKGIEMKLQKKLSEHAKINLVYGDGEAGTAELEKLYEDIHGETVPFDGRDEHGNSIPPETIATSLEPETEKA